jgi:hypothetical protein
MLKDKEYNIWMGTAYTELNNIEQLVLILFVAADHGERWTEKKSWIGASPACRPFYPVWLIFWRRNCRCWTKAGVQPRGRRQGCCCEGGPFAREPCPYGSCIVTRRFHRFSVLCGSEELYRYRSKFSYQLQLSKNCSFRFRKAVSACSVKKYFVFKGVKL